MVDTQRETPANHQGLLERITGSLPLLTNFRHRVRLLRWLIPAGLMLLVVFYELGPASWIYARFGFTHHIVAEILIFGTVGPALAFIVLDLLGRWLDEKDTSDFQSILLAQARRDVDNSRQLSDDALQISFAAGPLLTAYKSDPRTLSPKTAAEIEAAEQALGVAFQRLRSHLLT